MADTAKAIIIGSFIIGISIIAGTWIYTNNASKTDTNPNINRYSLIKSNSSTHEALKIDRKTGQVWIIDGKLGIEIEVK